MEHNIRQIIKDGRIQPSVHKSTPPIPERRIPTKVEEFIEIGPGVISATVIRWSNWNIFIFYLWNHITKELVL